MQLQEARDPDDARARFVYIEDDGSARELTPHECAYLAMPFDPPDGNRPYIKARYRSLTPDRRMRGFLERKHLPGHLRVTLRTDYLALALRREKFAGVRRVPHVLVALALACALGYGAWVTAAVSTTAFLDAHSRGLAIVLFVIGAFVGTIIYIVFGLFYAVSLTGFRGLLWFLATTGVCLGLFGGAISVLLAHGHPAPAATSSSGRPTDARTSARTVRSRAPAPR
ncbi:MAG: hypothetical protein ACJ79K_04640 [Gemmatimonadaceae bacterium]